MTMRSISAGILGLSIVFSGPTGFAVGTEVPLAEAAAATTPPFELVTFGGAGYSNTSLKGKPALLVFWAPWCKVCQRELPSISRFYEDGRPTTLEVVSIGFADTRSNVEAFVKERAESFAFPAAYDEDRWVSQAFKINATPTYVVLDDQGRIALFHRGGGIFQNLQFREFLSTLK
ncbi:MAG: TlpA disulfide reductase family protein [Nitrospiraceae bacterium]